MTRVPRAFCIRASVVLCLGLLATAPAWAQLATPELPIQGRQLTDLLVLSGAAVQTAEAANRTVPGGVRIAVAGGRPTGVGYTLDGATHNNPQDPALYSPAVLNLVRRLPTATDPCGQIT